MSPSERDRRKDWKARGKLNKKAKRDLEKRIKRDQRQQRRRDAGCAVTAISAGLAAATLAAQARGWYKM